MLFGFHYPLYFELFFICPFLAVNEKSAIFQGRTLDVLPVAGGGAFQHGQSFGNPHFNYTKKKSNAALWPGLRQTGVM
jgi:hypothetical protein